MKARRGEAVEGADASWDGRGDMRVKVADIPAAGVPFRVLRTWHVIGDDIFDFRFLSL